MNGQNISVIEPLGTAIERTKVILFKPFDAVKWLAIGFCAWLAYLSLCELGGGWGGGWIRDREDNLSINNSDVDNAKNFLVDNLPLIVSIAVVVLVIVIALAILFIWLRSRGKFMFLHCVALNVTEVKVPWSKYAKQANSLFLFLLVLTLLWFVCLIPLIGLIVFTAIAMANSGMAFPVGILTIICTIFVMIIVGILFALVGKFTNDFVVPIMYLRGGTCMNGWSEFWKLLCGNKGRFALYILFQIILGLAILVIVLVIVFVIKFVIMLGTCCCLGCLFATPCIGAFGLLPIVVSYIETVVLLPIFLFMRAYSLDYLAQYGSDYDVYPRREALNPSQELVQ